MNSGEPVSGKVVVVGQLLTLLDQMARPETAQQGFSFANLSAFLGNNLRFEISPEAAGAAPQGAMPAPMPPELRLADRDLSALNKVGALDHVNGDRTQ